MGIVINEELARASTCTCHQIGPTEEPKNLLCFIPGIVGALSDEQGAEFCKERKLVIGRQEWPDLEEPVKSVRLKWQNIQKVNI